MYHEATDAVYVFGGQRFHVETVSASPELYSLHYPNLTWSLLAPSHGHKVRAWGWGSGVAGIQDGLHDLMLCRLPSSPQHCVQPVPHVFHVAAVLGDTMVVVGGRAGTRDFSNHVLLYQVLCNAWILPDRTGTACTARPSETGVPHSPALAPFRVGGCLSSAS